MNIRALTAAGVATAALGVLSVAVPAAQATPGAGATTCRPGSVRIAFSQTVTSTRLTHARTVRAKGANTSLNTQVPRVGARFSAYKKGPGKATSVINGLEKATKLTLADVPSKTPANSVTVKGRIAKPGIYVAYAGVKMATGTYTVRTCNAKGTGYGPPRHGTAGSFAVKKGAAALATGLVSCRTKSVDELARKAQQHGC
ncbi:hypothetical protein [Streptomyces sp. NPDC088246]|uniref:hypothetical protein n=1 Tax=Streptomyces sp. NPDC088246 TaxID=3365842 RepID=UPI0037FC6BE4